MTKKTKLTRTLMAAVSVVALSAVVYGCSSGVSDADHRAAIEAEKQAAAEAAAAAAAKAKMEAEAAAAEAARIAAEEAEKAKQDAVAEAEKQAAEERAAAERMARATVQTNAITAAISAAETALGMVVLGASDADITAAEAAIAAITTAIEAAVDVDDTSMYSAQISGFEGRLMTARGLVHQDRAAKKMARAAMQKSAIADAIKAARDAVAMVDDGATDEEIDAAAMAAAEKVQAARDAIAAAVDVDDKSMYTTDIDGIESSLGTATDTAKSAYQTGRIMAAIRAAESAVGNVDLDATDMDIEAAEMAVQAAKDAIAAAEDVDDTSEYTATVDGLETSLTKAKVLVGQDRAAKKMARAEMQKGAIADAITAARNAVALVVDGASDEVIEDAEAAIMAAKTVIGDAEDVDDTSMYTATVNDLASNLTAAKITVLANRAAQNSIDIQIAGERERATAAMNAAKTAADNAKTAADEAEAARVNLATMQTNEKSGMSAKDARKYADDAMAAYMDAKAASEAADAAETVAAAVEARVDAEDAQDSAEDHEMKAGENKTSTTEAAANELFIDGTMKRVGGTTIDATAKSRVVTADGKTMNTGLQAKADQPMHKNVGMMAGQAFAAGTPDTTPPVADTPYRQAVAARDLTIGKTVDSSNDMARLMLVTHYAGSQTVKVYAENTAAAANGATAGIVTAPKTPGRVQVAGADTDTDTTDDRFANLRSLGTYYQATPGATDTDADSLDINDIVGKEAEGKTVYSYFDNGGTPDDDTDDATVYVVLSERSTSTPAGGDTTTTYTYQVVDIMVDASRPDGTDEDTDPDAGQVTATIPVATAYKHIHFGVWAGLSDAEDDGSQTIANLGIGFVQNHDGSGMTDDMPNNGTADYEGDWVAAVQAADGDGDGDIMLRTGVAELMADFGKDEITVDLQNLAMLKGDISGSTFGGTKASDISAMYDLDASGAFTGTFSGAFYGSKAAEAGGVFDFSSDGMEEGAFRGAFGGDKK